MRPMISLLSLTLLAPSALADDTPAAPAPTPSETAKPDESANAPDTKPPDAEAPDPTFSAIARSTLPPNCESHARYAHAMLRPIAAASRLALAQCLIGPGLAPIKSVLDTHESMQTLERAVAQSIVLFDEVIALGDPGQQVLAAHAKGQLYEDLLGRMAQAVPPPTVGDAALSLYRNRKALLELMLQPWRDEAAAAFEQAVAIAKAHPAIGSRNAMVRDVVARSAQRVQMIATAKAQAAAPPPTPTPAPASKLAPGTTAAPAETPPPPPPKDPPKDGASAPSASSATPSSPAPQ